MNRRPEELAERFFSGNAWSYDHIARVSTLGLDGWWKRKILKKIPKTADRILEQASGTGILTCKIARLFPKSRVIGVELHEEYLNVARKKARDLELSNVEFIHGRAEDVILTGKFDCIVSDYLAKYVDLDLLVAHASRMLRKGGLLVMHELTRPNSPAVPGALEYSLQVFAGLRKLETPRVDYGVQRCSILACKNPVGG